MKKTAQDITMDLLKGQSRVIDPIADLVKKQALLTELAKTFDLAGSAKDKTKGILFVGEQEQHIDNAKTQYMQYVIQAGFATSNTHKHTIFDDYEFKLVITPKD